MSKYDHTTLSTTPSTSPSTNQSAEKNEPTKSNESDSICERSKSILTENPKSSDPNPSNAKKSERNDGTELPGGIINTMGSSISSTIISNGGSTNCTNNSPIIGQDNGCSGVTTNGNVSSNLSAVNAIAINSRIDTDSNNKKILTSKFKSPEYESQKRQFLTKEKFINGYKSIQNIKPIVGQEYCIVAYILFDCISPEGDRGFWIFIRTCSNKEQAINYAHEIIETTGIKSVYAYKTCTWEKISTNFKPDSISYVTPKEKDEKEAVLDKQHKKEYDEMVQSLQKQEKIAEEIDNTIEEEKDINSLEYYKRLWFLIIKNNTEIINTKLKLQQLEQKQIERISMLHMARTKNPNYEKEWLPLIVNRLKERDEESMAIYLQEQYNELKNSILIN